MKSVPRRDPQPRETGEKITTLEALLALQSKNESLPRPNRSAPTNDLPHPSTPSDPTPRRKFGSQSLPRMNDNPDQLIDEINHLQHALVDKFRGNQKLVSGAQFRSGFKELKCEQCEAKDNLLKKTKENVRSLKFQISRLEDRLYNGKKTDKSDLNLSGQSLEVQGDDELRKTNEELLKQINDLEKTNQELFREKVNAEATAAEALKILRDKDQMIKNLQDEISVLKKTQAEDEKKVAMIKNQLTLKIEFANDLEGKLSDSCDEISQLKGLLDQYTQSTRQQEDWDLLQNEIQQLRRVINENEMNLRVIARQNEDLKANMTRLESEMKEKDLKSSDSYQQMIMYKDLLDIANRENAQLNDNLTKKDLQRQSSSSEVDSLRSILFEREKELARLQDEQNRGQDSLKATIANMNDMVKRLTSESEKSALAVQKAISSSVRLCVVAPTVNVHVADKKMKFRSSVPREALSDFLEQNILSKYTFLFEQRVENVAPDGVTDIQPWIKKILGDMQSSIEEHISSAMRSSS